MGGFPEGAPSGEVIAMISPPGKIPGRAAVVAGLPAAENDQADEQVGMLIQWPDELQPGPAVRKAERS